MKVVAEFEGGQVRPVKFWRGTREYKVKQVAMRFERRDGGRRYLCFSVGTGGMMAELVMDKEGMDWRIAKCEPYCI
ncbi:hypothetical protein HYW29_01990 [Candidatus Amesbacteria bacterium]|nr:hypothetical protein [Candidatus Amesbacteria bacterium]